VTAVPGIAIVGAGFAGTLLAVQLAAQARRPLHIVLYDARAAFARGVAYGTRDPSHLLNVRADRMGAFEDRQDDFYRWLLAHEAAWRRRHPALAALKVRPEGFMPRMLYGDYLTSLLEDARRNTGGVTLEQIEAEVTDAEVTESGINITLGDQSGRTVDYLVLAVGNLMAGRHGFEKAVSSNLRYTGNPWAAAEGSILTRDRFGGEDAPVLIIGTGLTMVDMLLSLRRRNYRGKIIAVSRHGLLPQPHDTEVPPYPRFLPPESAPRTAPGLVARIRQEIKQAQKAGFNWRGVVDSLRADTQALWANLPDDERRKLARILAYWSVHRHRMPVSSGEFIAREMKAGTLEMRSGRIENILEDAGGLCVTVRTRGNKTETVRAAHVLNCAGPGMNIDASENPLLLRLRDRGIIRKGPIGLGIGAEGDGRVKGGASERVFALGPLLAGEKFETIAVPEIRRQAEMVAGAVLKSLPSCLEPKAKDFTRAARDASLRSE
jgi:uncharacterized NAD(P)/FAD-binding protein YdhS